MKFLVDGIEKELELRDSRTNEDYLADVIGSYEVLEYDFDRCIMTAEQFEWWENVICDMQKINDILNDASEELKFEFCKLDFGCSDLDDEIRNQLEWLKNHGSAC